MHRSRLACVIIDCDDLKAGVEFWTAALGVGVRGKHEGGNTYVALESVVPKLMIWLQGVPDKKVAKTRIHLDFESDNVDAEADRLEALGARRQQRIEEWWVMEDPCGNEFCILPAFSEIFADEAKTWGSA